MVKTKQEQPPDYTRVRVVNTDYSIKIDDSKFTKSRTKFAQLKGWDERPNNGQRRNLPNTKDFKQLARPAPLKNYIVYPSTDPYSGTLRQLLKTINEECPWVDKSNEIMQHLVVSAAHREAMPRENLEMKPEELEKWQNKPIKVPFFKEKMTPKQLEVEMDKLAASLNFDNLIFDMYGFIREQGRSCLAMFPELRDKNTGKYQIPTAMTLIRPEFLRRPIKSQADGSLVGIETTQLTSNGSLLDANRAVYIFNGKNHDMFADDYGKSPIRSIVDPAKILLIIYGRDYENITINTYHTPYIFRHTLPTKNWSEADTKLDDFNAALENNQQKDISITSNVELLNPSGSNPGDIQGVNAIQNECIDAILGKFNIPPFIFGKAKPGRLGGNANIEEIDAFQKIGIKPQQEMLESNIEDQLYDRILAIWFDVEPEEATDPKKVPVKFTHTYEKPNIAVPFDAEFFNTMMFLVDNGLTTQERAFERMGMRDLLMDDATSPSGGDPSPSIKTWRKSSHNSWNPRGKPTSSALEWDDHKTWRKNFPLTRGDNANKLTDEKIATLKTIQDKIKKDRE